MTAARVVLAIAGAALLSVAGCGQSGKMPELMNLRSDSPGPDEFAIVPPKPLAMPEDLADLPAPTPGAGNRTDATPDADAIVALGGNPAAAGGIPAADGALVNNAGRHGVNGNIRPTLASEDLDYRRKHNGRILQRLFSVNVYYDAYGKMSLNQQAELSRWRKAGAKTPSAPPAQSGER
jgi:hypothetical protein